ncbi:hypothetical protein ACFX15_036615 [Malus domestica]
MALIIMLTSQCSLSLLLILVLLPLKFFVSSDFCLLLHSVQKLWRTRSSVKGTQEERLDEVTCDDDVGGVWKQIAQIGALVVTLLLYA